MICEPIFTHSKINHFEFMRVFPDSSLIWLTSNPAFIKKLSSLRWDRSDREDVSKVLESECGHHLWSCQSYRPGNRRLCVLQEFRLDHGLTIKESHKLHQDYYIFATQSENSDIYHYYFKNIEFLNRFIYYFKDKAQPIINKAQKEKLFIPHMKCLSNKFTKSISQSQKQPTSLEINKYVFVFKEKIIKLSTQEFNSLKLVARGLTIKETAKCLNISPRTVEYYLQSARYKMDLTSNRELIASYWQTALDTLQ